MSGSPQVEELTRGNVSLANVIGRYYPESTVLPLVKLFNYLVLEATDWLRIRR